MLTCGDRRRIAMTFRIVSTLARRFPEIEETTMYGEPALKLHGRLVACIASNKSAEPGTLVVRTTFDQRDVMIDEEPQTYYVKPHYQTFPVVLVRLRQVSRAAMADLIAGAVAAINADQANKKRPASRPSAAGRQAPPTRLARKMSGVPRPLASGSTPATRKPTRR